MTGAHLNREHPASGHIGPSASVGLIGFATLRGAAVYWPKPRLQNMYAGYIGQTP